MTATAFRTRSRPTQGGESRFRLHRAGILNVWQYDEQVFTFADGRLLLRGANGAGKSKTLEMLLPFALDGDKSRITASAKHHTSLLWLMTDGIDGGNRVGYVWVEFRRVTASGDEQSFTCGVGMRASTTGRTATSWHFATDRRVGEDLRLEDDAGPLSMPRLKEEIGAEHVFERAADYKAHVGRALFGLDPGPYDEVLRLLYWLRQPQVGEDIEPAKLAQQLAQALPQLDDRAVRTAGDTFDELTAVGEQLDRRAAAADALEALAGAYAVYARSVVAERARAVTEALRDERRLRRALGEAEVRAERVGADLEAARQSHARAEQERAAASARLRALEESPEFRNQRRLDDLARAADREAADAVTAGQRCTREEERVDRLERRVASSASETRRLAEAEVARCHELDAALRRLAPGADVPLAAGAAGLVFVGGEPHRPAGSDESAEEAQAAVVAGHVGAAVDRVQSALGDAASVVSGRRAAVSVVREALGEAGRATDRQRRAETEAERAQARWEEARDARLDAEKSAATERTALAGDLSRWAAGPASPVADTGAPSDLTAQTVSALPHWARTAASPRLDVLRTDQARRHAELTTARSALEELRAERAAVAAVRDPAPPPPPLPRTPRPDGHALWRVVDFASDVPGPDRAGIEAALQSSGLLDAWIRPGGRLVGRDERDVALAPHDAPTAYGVGTAPATLADVLLPSLPDDGGLADEEVAAVLAAVGLGSETAGTVWVGRDGAWRLGNAHGRAEKEQAQYIGASARAAERARRLALLDAAVAEQEAAEAAALDREAAARRAADVVEQWVAAVPSGRELLDALTVVEERERIEVREHDRDRAAQAAAHEARLDAARARDVLDALAREHELPVESTALGAVDEELRALADAVREGRRAEAPLRTTLRLWSEAAADHLAGVAALGLERDAARDTGARAEVARAEYEALRASVGDSVEQLQRRIRQVRAEEEAHARVARDAAAQADALNRAVGTALAEVSAARERLTDHEGGHRDAVASLDAAAVVPGLLDAAGVDAESAGAVRELAGHEWGRPVPRLVSSAVAALADLSSEESRTTTPKVWRAHSEAQSGPAADHQLAVADFGELLAVTGRDDGGEAVVVRLAARVRAGVERDRELLTEREKAQFEQHILGELGDAIRRCRREAEELVAAMNEQLGTVTTSQGIRTRLDWRLRDDVSPEARSAVGLLAQPVAALIPEERAALRDVLHRLIEASRAERPELSYAEHLTAALDYRTWSAFTIRYTRPETPGHWERLHRRSPLSQGEQKVLCYLPLFAAAAAHFTSLAGAAAHAPRLVLLDDAFPKIDVRTHPLLFGLLVDLDLDFVVTSERLWGDHASVPSLAIYEALRDPCQRGIAHVSYRWDGRVLESIG